MNHQPLHFQVGAFACTLVLDGTFAYPHPAQILFANAPQAEFQQALRNHAIDPAHWEHYLSPYPSLLINTGSQLVLVDTGAGHFGPDTGHLIPNLQAIGVIPEAINTVILTHAHLDHIGGIVNDAGKPAFPNARYVMGQTEWNFWTEATDLSWLPFPVELQQLFRNFIEKNLLPLQPQLDLIEAGAEIAPGIQVIEAPGHTPGHMALKITSAGEQLLYLVDTAIHPIHIEHPEWVAAVDYNPEQTVATRQRLFQQAVDEQALVHFYHFPFSGLGHIKQQGAGWQWQALS